MFAAVVPVHNEETRIGRLLRRLLSLSQLTEIIVIENGSNRETQAEVLEVWSDSGGRIRRVSFDAPLGIDVPRAVGARLAFDAGVDYVLFVDGDLVGEITSELFDILERTALLRPALALVDCYPQNPLAEAFDEPHFHFRRLLSKELGLYEKIGIASPSHGPHLVSRSLLSLVPWVDFCVPPTLLAHALLSRQEIAVIADIPHIRLGSQIKSSTHSRLIVDTIAGDCLEALCLFKGLPRSRACEDKIYLGYHKERRLDLLHSFLASLP